MSFSQAFPFSSFPKYFVQRILRESRFNSIELFLHLLEQNHRIVPSFLTYMMPVPSGNSCPQKEQNLSLGTGKPPVSSNFFGFPFSFPQHENVVGSHRTFHVSCYDAPFVPSFEHSNPDLGDLTSESCSTDHLNDFGGNYLLFLPLSRSSTKALLFHFLNPTGDFLYQSHCVANLGDAH